MTIIYATILIAYYISQKLLAICQQFLPIDKDVFIILQQVGIKRLSASYTISVNYIKGELQIIMPNFFDEGTDYSDYHYKNFRGNGDKDKDKKYYVSVKSGNNDSIMLKALQPDEIDNEPYHPVHTVEYINHDAPNKTNKIKKSKHRNPWRVRSVMLVVITIVICFMSTMLIADAMSGGYILDDLQATLTGKSVTQDVYYAIEIINFTDMTSARLYAEEIRGIGGAGYVVHDNLYRVIAEIFESKADADKVCAKLNTAGTMARIYEMPIKAIDYKLLPNSVRNISKKVMSYAHETYKSLYVIGAKLAGGEVDKNRAVTEIKTVRATLSAILIDYESNADNQKENEYVYKIRMQLGAVLAAIDNLCNSTDDNVGLLADIRYTNVMLINTHRALSLDIQNSEGKQ